MIGLVVSDRMSLHFFQSDSTILLIFQEHYFAWNLRFLLSHAAQHCHTTTLSIWRWWWRRQQFVSPCVLKVLPSSISFKVIRRSLWEVTASWDTVIFIIWWNFFLRNNWIKGIKQHCKNVMLNNFLEKSARLLGLIWNNVNIRCSDMTSPIIWFCYIKNIFQFAARNMKDPAEE